LDNAGLKHFQETFFQDDLDSKTKQINFFDILC